MNIKAVSAIEITSFKLLGKFTMADFIKINEDIDPWLKKQPGFRSRHMAEESNGRIMDMLIWDSAAEGKAAMQRLLSEFSDSPIHAMIDQQTVSWTITPVYHEWFNHQPV